MATFAGGFWLPLLFFSGLPLNLPLSLPPLPEDPVMQRMAPEQCLWYLSLAGVDRANAKSKNQVEQLLAEEDVQLFIREVTAQLETAFAKAAPDDPVKKTLGEEGPKLVETLLTRPVCVYLGNVGDAGAIRGGVVVNLGDQVAATKASLEKVEQALLTAAGKKPDIDVAGWHKVPLPAESPAIQWGIQDKYLLIGLGEGEAQQLNDRRVKAKGPPQWLAEMRKQVSVDRPSMAHYINLQAVGAAAQPLLGQMLPPELLKMFGEFTGTKNTKYFASISGLDQSGFVSRSLLAIDGQPTGLLSLIAGQPLTPESLSTIPADANFAVAARIDPDKIFEAFVTAAGAMEAQAPLEIDRSLKEMQQQTGVHFQNDLLGSLGDTWCLYNSPDEGGLFFTGLTLTATLRDRDKLAQVNEQLVGIARQMMEQQARQNGEGQTISDIEFKGQRIYFVNNLTESITVAPAWCITDDHLVASLFPQAIKSYLQRTSKTANAAGGERKSLAEVPAVAKLFADGKHPTVVSYQDTPNLFKLAYPVEQILAGMVFSSLHSDGIDLHIGMWPNARAIMPHLVAGVDTVEVTKEGLRFESHGSMPMGFGTLPVLMLPAWYFMAESEILPVVGVRNVGVAVAQADVNQSQSSENLRRLAEAVLTFESSSNHFPAAFAADQGGKPLLSWRVAILPFIGEDELASQFHLDEPWDSENNKKLIERMPEIFKAPGSKASAEFKTVYLSVRGEKTAFPGAKPVKLRSITDGAEQTIMFVEASDDKAVVWTKPDDFEPDDKNPIAGLVGLREKGFLAVFCDGHVMPIPEDIDADGLKAFFTRNGNEKLDEVNVKRRVPAEAK